MKLHFPKNATYQLLVGVKVLDQAFKTLLSLCFAFGALFQRIAENILY